MRVNTNHPTFIAFIETVNSNVLSNISVEKYFGLTTDKKRNFQYLTLKLIIKAVKVRATLTDSELLDFTKILRKKNEDLENYEFASVLNDIANNFDTICELTKTGIRKKRTVKTTDKSTEE